jgi:hypothetical protein
LAFPDHAQQSFVRRIYERLNNLEAAANLQSFENGRKAPAPPKAILNVTVNPSAPGHAFIRIVNPEFQTSRGNPIAAPIRHWIRASPFPQFNKSVTDFGITHQTYIDTKELGSGTFHFEVRSSFDGKTFTGPVRSGQVVIP